MSAAATYIADQGWPVMSGVQRSPFDAAGPRKHCGPEVSLPHRLFPRDVAGGTFLTCARNSLACCSSAAAAFAMHVRSSSATCRAAASYVLSMCSPVLVSRLSAAPACEAQSESSHRLGGAGWVLR